MKRQVGFKHAVRGIIVALRDELNMKIHLAAMIFVVILGFYRNFESWQWAAVIICFGLVIGAEMVNSAIERVCDRITGEREGIIRDIKDISSGAVLVCAIVAAVIAAVVFFY